MYIYRCFFFSSARMCGLYWIVIQICLYLYTEYGTSYQNTIHYYNTLLQYIIAIHYYNTLLPYIITIHYYNTLLPYIITIHYYHTLLPYFITIHYYNTLLPYIITIHYYHTLLPYIITIHYYHTLLQYIITIHYYHTLLQYIITIHYYHILLQYIITIHSIYLSTVKPVYKSQLRKVLYIQVKMIGTIHQWGKRCCPLQTVICYIEVSFKAGLTVLIWQPSFNFKIGHLTVSIQMNTRWVAKGIEIEPNSSAAGSNPFEISAKIARQIISTKPRLLYGECCAHSKQRKTCIFYTTLPYSENKGLFKNLSKFVGEYTQTFVRCVEMTKNGFGN